MIRCHIVKDLLPSHIDGLLSPETEQDVTQHLAECGDCRVLHQQMQMPLAANPIPAADKEVKYLLKLKTATAKKLGIALAALALVFVTLAGLFVIGLPVSSAEIEYETWLSAETSIVPLPKQHSGESGNDTIQVLSYNTWNIETALVNDKGFAMRVQPVYGKPDKNGVRPLECVILTPRKVIPTELTGSVGSNQTHGYHCDVDNFYQNGFKVILRLGDGDIEFTKFNLESDTTITHP